MAWWNNGWWEGDGATCYAGPVRVSHWMHKPKLPGVQDDREGIVLDCAVRDCISKKGGIPQAVAGYVASVAKELPTRALWCLKKDINYRLTHNAVGEPSLWFGVIEKINAELEKRGKL